MFRNYWILRGHGYWPHMAWERHRRHGVVGGWTWGSEFVGCDLMIDAIRGHFYALLFYVWMGRRRLQLQIWPPSKWRNLAS